MSGIIKRNLEHSDINKHCISVKQIHFNCCDLSKIVCLLTMEIYHVTAGKFFTKIFTNES